MLTNDSLDRHTIASLNNKQHGTLNGTQWIRNCCCHCKNSHITFIYQLCLIDFCFPHTRVMPFVLPTFLLYFGFSICDFRLNLRSKIWTGSICCCASSAHGMADKIKFSSHQWYMQTALIQQANNCIDWTNLYQYRKTCLIVVHLHKNCFNFFSLPKFDASKWKTM